MQLETNMSRVGFSPPTRSWWGKPHPTFSIHGYDLVEDAVVWDVIAKDLPLLHSQVVKLLGKPH
jgi:hypothetical protein